MRVAVLTTVFPRRPGDFFGNYIFHLARAHVERGVEVHVLAPHTAGARTRESIEGVQVSRFRYAPARFERLAYAGGISLELQRSRLNRALLPLFVIAFVVRAIGVVRHADVVHAHWTLAGAIGIGLARVFGKRPLLTIYGVEVYTGRFRLLTKLCVRFAGHVICISEATAAKLRETLGPVPKRRLSVVPYGVPEEFASARGDIDVRERHGIEGPLLLSVGRLIPRKGLEHLLRAMPGLAARTGARLIVAGEGMERQRLEALVRELGAGGCATFAGEAPPDELVSYYDACDVFVHPVVTDPSGDVEGLGLVLLEAMARGRPVVASGIGGIRDVVVDGETGLLVPEQDSDALAAAIERLLGDDALRARLGEAGRRRVEARFSVPGLAARVLELYGPPGAAPTRYGWEGAPGAGHEIGPGFLARSQLVERWAARLRPALALEAGCGRGNLTKRIARSCGRVVATDLSLEAARLARDACEDEGNVDVVAADAGALPFRPAFDAVVLAEVLEHLDDDRGALEHATSLLADGGRLIVTVPSDPALWTVQDEMAGHKRRYTRRELYRLLARAGFAVEDFVCWGYPVTKQLVLRGGPAAARYRSEGRSALPLLMRLARRLYAPLARPVARLEYLLSGLDRGAGYALVAVRGSRDQRR